jgi:hypothetical protein
MDTLNGGMDSVVAILTSNQGNMEDADIQLVFAYMANGHYSTALEKVTALDGRRSDWASLLTKLIEIDQESDGIFSLNSNTTNRTFLQDNYANVEGKDGQSIAQAVLKACCDIDFTEPHTFPEGYSGARIAQQQQPEQKKDKGINTDIMEIKIYPNPTKSGVNIYYNGIADGPVKIEVKDLLGRVIYTKFIMSNLIEEFIPMTELNNGMYLITLIKNQQIIYKTKLIKEE